eukprot:scaffold33127_cov157-Isochrysis_galbana.AAC.1
MGARVMAKKRSAALAEIRAGAWALPRRLRCRHAQSGVTRGGAGCGALVACARPGLRAESRGQESLARAACQSQRKPGVAHEVVRVYAALAVAVCGCAHIWGVDDRAARMCGAARQGAAMAVDGRVRHACHWLMTHGRAAPKYCQEVECGAPPCVCCMVHLMSCVTRIACGHGAVCMS